MSLFPPFKARYRGKCTRCREPFDVGTLINYNEDEDSGGGYVHDEACAPEPSEDMTPEEARAKLCGSCFLVHAPGQKECW